MSPLRMQLDRIRQGTWLVVLITVFAVIGAVGSTYVAGTTYTGRATLSIGSQYRAPEQDAVLATGYADLFNEGSYQQKLLTAARVPAGITLSARTAAASPILYIEATGKDSRAVSAAASTMAAAFLDDVNASIQSDQDSKVAALNAQIEVQRKQLSEALGGSQEAALASQNISAMLTQVNTVRGDTTNQLRELQPLAGVAAKAPSLAMNAGLALVGGLLFGLLAALGLAALRNRISTVAEARDRLGLTVLAEIKRGKSAAAGLERTQQLNRLANLVGPTALPRPAVIAVTAPRRSVGTGIIAEAVAVRRAGQGERTVLLQADMHVWSEDDEGGRGVSDVLAVGSDTTIASVLQPGTVSGLWVAPVGGADADPFSLFAPDRIARLLAELTRRAGTVVIEVPPLLESAEAQALCAAADCTVLVLASGATRAVDAREALAMLAQVDATAQGVVLIDRAVNAEPREPSTAIEAVWDPAPVGSALPPTAPSIDHPSSDLSSTEWSSDERSSIGDAASPKMRVVEDTGSNGNAVSETAAVPAVVPRDEGDGWAHPQPYRAVPSRPSGRIASR